jgi:hypothetical protein
MHTLSMLTAQTKLLLSFGLHTEFLSKKALQIPELPAATKRTMEKKTCPSLCDKV